MLQRHRIIMLGGFGVLSTLLRLKGTFADVTPYCLPIGSITMNLPRQPSILISHLPQAVRSEILPLISFFIRHMLSSISLGEFISCP